MLRKLDRIAIIVVSAGVGLQAVIPGWQIMTDGSVYGFKLPTSWLSGAWPFADFTAAGLILLVVVGGGSLVTTCIAAFRPKAGSMAALILGLVLIGWIGGELIFLTQTMIMTWVVLGSGVLLLALAAPYSVPELLRAYRQRASDSAKPIAAP